MLVQFETLSNTNQKESTKSEHLFQTDRLTIEKPFQSGKPVFTPYLQPADQDISPRSIEGNLRGDDIYDYASSIQRDQALQKSNLDRYLQQLTLKIGRDEEPKRSSNTRFWKFKQVTAQKKQRKIEYIVNLLQKASNNLKLSKLTPDELSHVKTLVDFRLRDKKQKLKILQFIPVFDAQGRSILFFDTSLFLLFLFSLFWLPIQLFFNDQSKIGTITYFIMPLAQALEILVTFNKQMLREGQIIKNRLEIAKVYLKNTFLFDLISLLCLLINLTELNHPWQIVSSVVFMILKIDSTLSRLESLTDFFNFSPLVRDFVSLVNMITSMILIVHIIACVWHGVGSSSQGTTWISYYGYDQDSLMFRYQVSFYWAAMTMTTVGYGDITPKNQGEYICANITMLFACIVFGYTMNRIGILLGNINQRNASVRQVKALINLYMHDNQIDFKLQSRIRNYFEYMYNREHNEETNELKKLLEKLPASLHSELNDQIRGKKIKKCTVLDRFSDDFKRSLNVIAEDISFYPGEKIFDPEVYDNYPMFILQTGKIRITGSKLANNNKNQMFETEQLLGEISFFTNQPRTVGMVSQGFSKMIKISREVALKKLNDFPRDKELFHYIKDSLTFEQQYLKIQLRCLCCKSDSHIIKNCPLVNLVIDREKILKEHLFPFYQQRRACTIHRVTFTKYKTLKFNRTLKKTVFLYRTTIDGTLLQTEESVSLDNSASNVTSSEDFDRDDHQENNIQLQLALQSSFSDQQYQELEKLSQYGRRNKQRTRVPQKPFESSKLYESQISVEPVSNYKSLQKVYGISMKTDQKEQSFHQLKQQTKSLKYIENERKQHPKKQSKKITSNRLIGSGNVRFDDSVRLHDPFATSQIWETDFDKMQNYSNYYPNWNYDVTIKRINEKLGDLTKPRFSNYTFRNLVMKKLSRFRRHILKSHNRYHEDSSKIT